MKEKLHILKDKLHILVIEDDELDRMIIKRACAGAGLSAKRIYPHLFRHTRATHLLLTGQMNETQAKVYFGWSPDSKMIGR